MSEIRPGSVTSDHCGDARKRAAPNLRAGDSLDALLAEVRAHARGTGAADQSERDAMLAVAEWAVVLRERLQAILDWADFALAQPNEFNSHGVLNLDGPVFDEARAAITDSEAA